MLLKAALTFLAIGALSVNAMTAPVARSPAPEPESQELEAWMLKRQNGGLQVPGRNTKSKATLNRRDIAQELETWMLKRQYERGQQNPKYLEVPANPVHNPGYTGRQKF